ncbi:MAG TPA: hypothetical protein VFT22_07350 [Kofleriaceae bacterium]|nr:hypothetical protein [Kofleriaceae bacterium]
MRELVSSTFLTAWTAQAPTVPLVLENEVLPSSDRFALLTIVPTTSEQTTQGRVGTRRVRRNGWIQVKLWTPANGGSRELAQLGGIAGAILELSSFPSPVAGDEPVTTLAAQSGAGGTDGRWYMGLVRVPFWYAEQV